MSFNIVGFSGSTRRPSRTSDVIMQIGQELGRRVPVAFELFEISDIGPGIGAFSREALPRAGQDALAAIEGADALIVGSPIYKGSYTGLFKHVFDFVDPAALAGKPVALTASGGGRRHALVVEHQLRPLFGFFSALALPTAVYASDEDYRDGALADPTTLDRVRQVASELAFHLSARRIEANVVVPLGRVA